MIVADLSGGKDSMAMGLRLVELDAPVDAFVSVLTGYEHPEALAALALFEEMTGRAVERLRPPRDFLMVAAEIPNGGKMERARGYGWPHFRRRWCNYELKRAALQVYDRAHGHPLHLVGIASDETKRLKPKRNVIYPLDVWGWTEGACLEYCKWRGMDFGGFYDTHRRMGCYICPFQSTSDARWLAANRPALWAKVKEMERVIGEPWKGGTERYEKEDEK